MNSQSLQIQKRNQMKTLKGILEQSKMYATADTERFVAKHAAKVSKLSKETEDDKLFKATNIKTVNREDEHGYNADGSDEKVYEEVESVDEKKLTPAEMKKREEVAKAIERENPGMAMGKKMAIATSTAKKVAEETELQEGEVAHAQYKQYHGEAKKMLDKIAKGLDTHAKNITSKDNYNGGEAHWGHVGDMKHFHRQIQDLHDQVLQTGEYSAPPKVMKLKEEVEQDITEEQYSEIIEAIMEDMTDVEREEFLQLMETEEGCQEIVEMLDEVFNAEQLED